MRYKNKFGAGREVAGKSHPLAGLDIVERSLIDTIHQVELPVSNTKEKNMAISDRQTGSAQ
jgi:hypothetical protein